MNLLNYLEEMECLVRQMLDHSSSVTLDLSALTECLRKLRNLCAGDPTSQKSMGENSTLLITTSQMIDRLLLLQKSDEQLTCLRVCAQFLGNLCANNSDCLLNIYEHCFKSIRKLIFYGDEKLSLYSTMPIHCMLLGLPDIRNDLFTEEDLMKKLLLQDNEFSIFVIEELLLKHLEIEKLYAIADSNQRLTILAALYENKSKLHFPQSSIMFLVERFKRESDKILKIVTTYMEGMDPEEVCLMLQFLSAISSESPYMEWLQTDKSIFINCSFLLRSVHEIGKSSQNYFSGIQTIASGAPNSQLQTEPAFAFKVDLIRLLGNLCWKCKDLQNLMRELECIPILLECCNIDDRNPFITQWSVLAIRNLCEGNIENQKMIAGLSQKGVVPSPVLNELGLTLASEGGKEIKIMPLKR